MRLPTSSRQIAALLPRRNCLVHPTVMLRRTALEAVNGYRLDYVEDYDLWLRLSESHDLANLEEPMILYRRHPAQISLHMLEKQATRAARCAGGRPDTSGRWQGSSRGRHGTSRPSSSTGLAIGRAEIERAVEHEWYSGAAILRLNGQDDEADTVTGAAVAALGAHARRGIAAATLLQRTESMLQQRRRSLAALALVRALIASPGYTSSRVREQLRIRTHR